MKQSVSIPLISNQWRRNGFGSNFTRLVFLVLLVACPRAVCAQVAGTQHGAGQPPPSAAQLIRGLQSVDPAGRKHAVKAAMRTKPLPLSVVPYLLDCFKDTNLHRGYVVRALTNAGPRALPQLTRALDNPDQIVRAGAVDAFLLIARESRSTWPVIISALANTHEDVVCRLEGEIPTGMGAPVIPLLRSSLKAPDLRLLRLKAPDLRIRSGAAVALSYIVEWYVSNSSAQTGSEHPHGWKYSTGVPPSEIIGDLVRVSNSIEPEARLRVASALTRIGPAAKGLIPAVLPMLRDSNPNNRELALNFLAAMGAAADSAVPDLIDVLKDPALQVRLKAIDILGALGSGAKTAIPNLAISLKSTDPQVSEHGAMALANIDPSHQGILPILIPMLNECCETVSAINAVGNMGSNAQQAIPILVRLLTTDTQPSERQAAAAALARIEGASAVPILKRTIRNDKDESVRIAAATALGGLGSSSDRAIAALADVLSNDSAAVRDGASTALSSLGGAAVPVLIVALSKPDLYQRLWAIQTLSRIKPLPEDASRALTRALLDKSELVRSEAKAPLNGGQVSAMDTINNFQLIADADRAQTAEQGLASSPAAASKSARSYTGAEVIAPIRPDENHEYPAALKYLTRVQPSRNSSADAEFIATVHSAQDNTDRLAIWQRIGAHNYQLLMTDQADVDAQFDEPKVFSSRVLVTGEANQHYETALFLDIPLHRQWGDGDGVDDTVFVIDHDQLRPVRIQSADDWYARQLRPGEWTWNSLANTFADNDLEFEFFIWEKDQCHACAGGAQVNGTYKVIKEMRYDRRKETWMASWKMVVDTARRRPRSD